LDNITEREIIDTLIISDIHLGSEVARPQKAKEVTQKYIFNRIILLGDIFDDLNFNRLKKEHWNFLSHIRKLSNPRRNIEVVWVEGNHDAGLSKIMSHMMGLKVYKQYIFESGEKKVIAIHGHQFDRFLTENVVISNIASFIYTQVQKLGGEKQRFARFLKRQSKGWLRLAEKVAVRAIGYAYRKKVDIIICGHTHIATEEPFILDDIKYYNTGCMTDIPSNYIVIDKEGNITVKEIN